MMTRTTKIKVMAAIINVIIEGGAEKVTISESACKLVIQRCSPPILMFHPLTDLGFGVRSRSFQDSPISMHMVN